MFNTQNIISNITKEHNYNKNLIYYNTNLIYFDLFKIIKTKIEKIKILKYKNLVEYKELILYYNNFIKKYNLYIYGIKYEIFTIDLFKKKNVNNINLIPEISPFKVSHNIYNNIVKSKTKSYKIKGFICFIVYRKTKTQESTKIYIFSNLKHKEGNYYVYDIREILKFISPQILIEIDILIKRDININSDDMYIGYLATISDDLINYDKKNVIDMFYFYNDFVNSTLYIHIYFKIEQYKKNTNKYNFISINKDNFTGLKYLFYDLEYNDNYNDPGIILNNNNIYIASNSFIKSEFNNNYKINDNLDIHMVLQYKNKLFNFTCDFKSLLYSTNVLYILKHSEKLYIIDLFDKDIEKSELYKVINNSYILKKNDIIFKKNISKSLEMLLKIDTNVINWYDFIKNSDKFKSDMNLYDWFIKNYKKYKNYNEFQQISKSFKYLSLFDIFVLIFDDENLEHFIKYYEKRYKIENQNIVCIYNNNIEENNSKYDDFIDIIKIFLYLYNFN